MPFWTCWPRVSPEGFLLHSGVTGGWGVSPEGYSWHAEVTGGGGGVEDLSRCPGPVGFNLNHGVLLAFEGDKPVQGPS